MDIHRTSSPRPGARRAAPALPASPGRPGSPSLGASVDHGASGSSHRPSGSGNIFYNSSVDEFCQIKTFDTPNYSTKDLLAGLSDKLITQSKANPGPFNPRPFIRTYESAVDSLLQLRSTITAQESQLASTVQVSESAYAAKLKDLSSNFDSVSTSFTGLEDRFADVGRTALQIGEQLQTIDRLRTRAAEASDLIEYYYQFARGDTSRLDRLRREGGREGRLKTAVIARRLGAIAREVDMPGADKTRDTVDVFSEKFERDMLKLFDKFYRKSDPKMMSHIAKVLQNFNGGHSCVQIYVNQHDFFISKDRVGGAESVGASEIWTTISDPDAPAPKVEAGLAQLFAEIKQTVEIEAQIIQAVFPSPLLVMSTFLQRVFAQSIQLHVERLMEKAAEVGAVSNGVAGQSGTSAPTAAGALAGSDPSTGPGSSSLAFLRTLHMARSMALALVTELKVYDYRSADAGGSSSANRSTFQDASSFSLLGGHTLLGSNSSSAAAGGGSALGSMLDQAVEELFVPYMEGIRYLERESRSLTDLYAAYLLRFSNAHRSAPQIKTSTIFDRVRAQVQAASTSSASSLQPSSAGSTASAATSLTAGAGPGASSSIPATKSTFGFSKLSGLVDRARGGTSSAEPAGTLTVAPEVSTESGGLSATGAEDGDGDLSLEVAERMLRWHAEAIGRCVDLSPASDIPKNAFALLKVLVEAFFQLYVEVALDSAQTTVNGQDVRSTSLPDLSYLSVLRSVELITQLWQHYVNTALLPLASSSVTIRREMAIYNNHCLLKTEGKCDAVLQKSVDNIVAFLTARLATQKKNDFTPKNDDVAFARSNTDACVACCDALGRVASAARRLLGGGKNSEAFLTEVGVTFHGLLLEHFKKFTISADGGILLGQDLSAYQSAVAAFNVPALQDRFDMLRQLGNLFFLPPAVLKSYMREGHLANIEERLLRPYLLRRADYAKDIRDLDTSSGSTMGGTVPSSASHPDVESLSVFSVGSDPGAKADKLAQIMLAMEKRAGSHPAAA